MNNYSHQLTCQTMTSCPVALSWVQTPDGFRIGAVCGVTHRLTPPGNVEEGSLSPRPLRAVTRNSNDRQGITVTKAATLGSLLPELGFIATLAPISKPSVLLVDDALDGDAVGDPSRT